MVQSEGGQPVNDPEDFFILLTPTHRMANAQTFFCIERAHMAGIPFIWKPHAGDALIGRARSIEATFVLEQSPSPYAIFLDSDIIFEPDDLLKLWHRLKEGYELVGGLYVVRSGAQLAHYGKEPNGGVRLDGTVQEVDYLSTGFMGFTKGLLQKIVTGCELPVCHPNDKNIRQYPFFENGRWWYEREKQWIYISEDWDFCEKAKKVGVKPYVDTSIQVGHEGWKVWTLGDLPKERITAVPSDTNHPLGLVLPSQMNRAMRRGHPSPVASQPRRR